MDLLRFLGLLFTLVSILAGSAAVIALTILAIRFWPFLLTIILALATFHVAAQRIFSR